MIQQYKKDWLKSTRRKVRGFCVVLTTQVLLCALLFSAFFASEAEKALAEVPAEAQSSSELRRSLIHPPIHLQSNAPCSNERQMAEEVTLDSASTNALIEKIIRCANLAREGTPSNSTGTAASSDQHEERDAQHHPQTSGRQVVLHPSINKTSTNNNSETTERVSRPSQAPTGANITSAKITVKKTVGTPIDKSCPSTDAITVTAGTTVIYCYEVINDGAITLTHHTVTDDQVGTILANYAYTLNPVPQPGSSVLFTITHPITESTSSIVTWTGTADGGAISAIATDTTSVLVPSIAITATVGIAPESCEETIFIYVPSGMPVYNCVTIKNVGDVTLSFHSLLKGVETAHFTDQPHQLAAQEQVSSVALGIVVSETVTQSVENLFTWSASTGDGAGDEADGSSGSNSFYATATAMSAVQIPMPSVSFSKTVGTDANDCATTTELTVLASTPITYCYRIINSGDVPLRFQRVVDSALGTLVDDIDLLLQPQETAEFRIPTVITKTLISSATWAASTDPALLATGESMTVSERSTTTVNVIPPANVTAVIFNDSNQNQTLDNAETGLLGAEAILTNADGQAFVGTSDISGTVTFSALEPGLYTLTISSQSLGEINMPTTDEMPVRIAVAGGEKEIKYFGFLKSVYRTLLPFITQE